MRLSISSVFDFASIAANKAAQEIKPLVDHYNQSLNELVLALTNRLTLSQNFLGQQVTVELVHNVESKIAINRPQVLGVLALKTISTTDTLTTLVSSVNQQGQLVLVPQFKLASASKVNVILFILFPD